MSIARRCSTLVLASLLLGSFVSAAHAQRGGGRFGGRMFQVPVASLTQLEVVQKDLKLTDEQLEKLAELNDDLNERRRELFQPGGDRDAFREKWAKLNEDAAAGVNDILDDDQEKRARELYIQANGPAVLLDETVSEPLKVTGEQQEQLREVLAASRDEFMNAGLRDMDQEEAAEKVKELFASRDEKLLAVLTEEQRDQFGKMQGEKIEIDLTKLPRPGRS